ncbi:MAG: hypothetical protein MH132_08275 [Hydrotalea sp.]|nr:hypothetical protein [Hydrotalea sp.]
MKNKHHIRWLIQAPVGLILFGAGLSMAIDAGFERYQGNSWFWYGTEALIICNAGLCIFGDSILQKVAAEKKHSDN